MLEMRAAWTSVWAPLACALAVGALEAGGVVAAEPLPPAEGPVLLVVSGNLEVTNSPQGAQFDREMLYGLGLTAVDTTTAWTDGVQAFEGVLLSAVLDRVGAHGTTITATAINDYEARIPIEDAATYEVLLAAKMNGTEMTVRDRGPLWIVYPRDSYPVLMEPLFNDRWVWQLREIRVE